MLQLEAAGLGDGAPVGVGRRILDPQTPRCQPSRVRFEHIDMDELEPIPEFPAEGPEAHGLPGEGASSEASKDQRDGHDPAEIGKTDNLLAIRSE